MGKCCILVIFSLPKSGVDKMNQYTPGYTYYGYGYVTLRQKRTHDVALKIYECYHSFVVPYNISRVFLILVLFTCACAAWGDRYLQHIIG